MDIFQRCGLENLMKISLISKQFYFLLKSDNFWIKMLKTTYLNEIEIEELIKTQSLVEIYRNTLCGWDLETSHKSLTFKGNQVTHSGKKNLAAAFTKKKYILGEVNIIFTFKVKPKSNFTATGVCIDNW